MDNPEPSLSYEEGVEIRDESMQLNTRSPIRMGKKFLLGAILGDGHLQKQGEDRAILVFNHSAKQLEYVLWKMQMLQPVVGGFAIRLYRRPFKYKGWKMLTHVRAWTLGQKYLGHIFNDFYFEREGKRRKEIHINVLRRLTPESLAVWYLDDGSIGRYSSGLVNSVELAVCGFTDEERECICQWLMDEWKCSFTQTMKKTIRTDIQSAHTFLNIIRPYAAPSMTYKFAEQYDSSQSAESLSLRDANDMIRTASEDAELIRNYQSQRPDAGSGKSIYRV
jgi:recombination protein RecA